MARLGLARAALLAAAGLALAACEPLARPSTPVPPPAPARPIAEATAPGAESRALSAYYARVEADLLAQGLLRTDGGGADVPFTERQLAENFIRIALYEEFTNIGGRMVARQSESRLHRWEQPIRMTVEFGATVPEAQRARDLDSVVSYARRLSRVSGLPIRITDSAPNFHVLFLNEAERRALGPRLRQIVPGIGQGAVEAIVDIPRSTYCLVIAVDRDNDGAYTQAVAIIRGEHPDLLRLSCVHEELAQGLGLSNDSPAARPSIFNDDEEFGLLTSHDELLLRILYDRRLRPGMTAAEARPIVREIAAEQMGGES